jgi:predicted Zn finger-like uncharacterized protein
MNAAMFTVCPKCALTLVVTAADLRVAQGYVRCGRCSSVFNALARLSDERQAGAPGAEASAQPDPQPVEPAPETDTDLSPLERALAGPDEEPATEPASAAEDSIPEDALEFNPETTDVGAVFVEPPPNPQWTAATGSFNAMRAASQSSGKNSPQAPSEPGETQVDVEIDAAFLADMLREPTESEPQSPEPERSELQRSAGQSAEPQPEQQPEPQAEAQRSEPEPSEPQPQSQPSASGRSEALTMRRAQSAHLPPAAAQAPTGTTRAAPRKRAASPPQAGARALPVDSSAARVPARHGTPHTRPPAEASPRPRSVAARRPESSAEDTTVRTVEESNSAPLDIAEPEYAIAKVAKAQPPLYARLSPHAWGAGAALAVLVLLAQIVNHYRDELATNPRFSKPLTTLYGSLGVQLVPHWDLRAYDVRQLGASADPAGSGLITVRASIKNAGHHAQPLPLLRVTLQDRFGNRIAARDVAPRFYVPHTMPDTSYLAGGQRIDAEMGFVDPGANAVGFEIDACLPARGGGVTCANDLDAR